MASHEASNPDTKIVVGAAKEAAANPAEWDVCRDCMRPLAESLRGISKRMYPDSDRAILDRLGELWERAFRLGYPSRIGNDNAKELFGVMAELNAVAWPPTPMLIRDAYSANWVEMAIVYLKAFGSVDLACDFERTLTGPVDEFQTLYSEAERIRDAAFPSEHQSVLNTIERHPGVPVGFRVRSEPEGRALLRPFAISGAIQAADDNEQAVEIRQRYADIRGKFARAAKYLDRLALCLEAKGVQRLNMQASVVNDDPPDDPPATPRRKSQDIETKIGAAIALKSNRPELSDRQIEKEAGLYQGALSKSPLYKAAKGRIEGTRDRPDGRGNRRVGGILRPLG